jgi:hypothetical protein
MALMDKPNEVGIEDATEIENLVALDETGDVESENEDLSGIAGFVKSQFQRSKDFRISDEERWLVAYRNYRGIYGPDVQFTSTEKSKAFIKVTKTKVLAAYASMIDVLMAGNQFPIGIENRKFPLGVADAVSYDPQAITSEKVEEKTGTSYDVPRTVVRPDLATDLGNFAADTQPIEGELEMGPGKTVSSITFEPAKDAARKMEKKIHDQLSESSAEKHLRSTVFECSLFGTGIMKGPFAYDKEYPNWNDEGEYEPSFETIPKIEYVSIWDFYPDPDSRNMEDAEYAIQRSRMSRTQLRGLKKRPHFRDESIELAILDGPNYIREYFESTLEDDADSSRIDRYEVLEFWGSMDSELAAEADFDIPEEMKDLDQLQVNIWICNGQILRLVLNPFTPTRIPFCAVPYEMNPYSFFGIGVAENMQDTQLLLNGVLRMSVDNAALSGNLLIEVDETNLVPGQDLEVYPGKVFRRQAGAPGQAIFGTKFPNVSQELGMMFDKFRQLADEATGIPSFSHGMSGVTGVGRTASGMSMLMGAASQSIKAVVRNMDDYLLAPMGKALFSFNQQFNFDKEFAQGDLEVKANGTESLMRNEVRSQKLLQFMQMSANPQLTPFVKHDYILRELAASMDLDAEKVMNDPREAVIQAKMMAEIQALMPQPEPGQNPQGGPMPQGDPSQTGAPPTPGEQGFTGAGGGANGGNPPPQQQGQQQPGQQQAAAMAPQAPMQ